MEDERFPDGDKSKHTLKSSLLNNHKNCQNYGGSSLIFIGT